MLIDGLQVDMPSERSVLQCVAACCSVWQCVDTSPIIILIDRLQVDMRSERRLMTISLHLSLVQKNKWTSRFSYSNPTALEDLASLQSDDGWAGERKGIAKDQLWDMLICHLWQRCLYYANTQRAYLVLTS